MTGMAPQQQNPNALLRADFSMILMEIKDPGSTRIGAGIIPSALAEKNELRNPPIESISSIYQLVQFISHTLPGGLDRTRVSNFLGGETHGQELLRRSDAAAKISRRARRIDQEYLSGYSMLYLCETPTQFFAAIDRATVMLGYSTEFTGKISEGFKAIRRPHIEYDKMSALSNMAMPMLLRIYQELRSQGYSHRDLAGVPPEPRG